MLSAEQIERYRNEGFLCPIPVLAPDELRRCQEGFAELEAELGPVKRFDGGHRYFGWAHDLATHPRIADTVEALLGPDLLVCGSLIFAKPPHDPGYVAWHQDSVYSNWHLTPTTSAWIALAPSTPENGCMRVIPGSHRGGLREHRERRSEGNLLNRGEEIEVEVDESEAHDLALQPGEMSLHESNIIHGSRPNRSDVQRIGFIIRFVTPAYRAPTRAPMLRVRGNADCSHFEMIEEARPEHDTRAGLAAWRAVTRAA